jgi:hypothetical protein
MRSSSKGLYALEAMTNPARNYSEQATEIHEIDEAERMPEKFLELILIDLKNARLVDGLRGARDGHRLAEATEQDLLVQNHLQHRWTGCSPGDAESLRRLVKRTSSTAPFTRRYSTSGTPRPAFLTTPVRPVCAPGLPRTKSREARTVLHRSG